MGILLLLLMMMLLLLLLWLLPHYMYGYMYMYYIYVQGASRATWKAAGRRLAYAQNVSDGVVRDGGNT